MRRTLRRNHQRKAAFIAMVVVVLALAIVGLAAGSGGHGNHYGWGNWHWSPPPPPVITFPEYDWDNNISNVNVNASIENNSLVNLDGINIGDAGWGWPCGGCSGYADDPWADLDIDINQLGNIEINVDVDQD